MRFERAGFIGDVAIDRQAPVIARGSVRIGVALPVVWRLMSDVTSWPSWNRDIEWVDDQQLAVDGSFRWGVGRWRITSRMVACEPYRLMAWTGSMPGIQAVHVWRIQQWHEATQVETEESWSGPLPRLMPRRSQAELDRAVVGGLGYLKRAAEEQWSLPHVRARLAHPSQT